MLLELGFEIHYACLERRHLGQQGQYARADRGRSRCPVSRGDAERWQLVVHGINMPDRVEAVKYGSLALSHAYLDTEARERVQPQYVACDL